jgi:hypothetical protein
MSDTTQHVGWESFDPNYLTVLPSPEQYTNSDVTPRGRIIRFLAAVVLPGGDNL